MKELIEIEKVEDHDSVVWYGRCKYTLDPTGLTSREIVHKTETFDEWSKELEQEQTKMLREYLFNKMIIDIQVDVLKRYGQVILIKDARD